jgi:hypothetical protein
MVKQRTLPGNLLISTNKVAVLLPLPPRIVNLQNMFYKGKKIFRAQAKGKSA